MGPNWKLSPSDLTFLWDECKRCFYLKVVHNYGRPSSPFPSIFGKIDLLMKAYFEPRSTQQMDPSLPPGHVLFGEKWVQSLPITNRTGGAAYFRGKTDTIVAFDDGSYGVIDFKTSTPKPEHVNFYGRQLHAYAYALEHPAEDKLGLTPISVLGLVVLEPVGLTEGYDGGSIFNNQLTWVPIPRDEDTFLGFIDEVLAVLSQPLPPDPDEKCPWCQYRQKVLANPEF